MKQIQELSLTKRKEKGKRREQTSYIPGAIPSEPILPRHVRPEASPISPGSREPSTPKTEERSQSIQKNIVFFTPDPQIPLPDKICKVTSPIFEIRAKDYNVDFAGNELEKFIKRVEAATEFEGASREDIEP
ncbi:hypothetical protein O181_098702 [Austropuccinia psidii MF-1]|uniref:Uncharacterized protein n=1 Tax=Austropuccinia psidii MF-1 TaxID=1389203 RepID=A0A9Q3JAX9_9BASI|nr:hypothetical protein [Austropuccinia psidii MF-1]